MMTGRMRKMRKQTTIKRTELAKKKHQAMVRVPDWDCCAPGGVTVICAKCGHKFCAGCTHECPECGFKYVLKDHRMREDEAADKAFERVIPKTWKDEEEPK